MKMNQIQRKKDGWMDAASRVVQMDGWMQLLGLCTITGICHSQNWRCTLYTMFFSGTQPEGL